MEEVNFNFPHTLPLKSR